MLPFVATYITYKDIYKDKPPSLEEVQEYFSTLHTGHLIQGLSKLNIALWKGSNDGHILAALAKLFFNIDDLKEIYKVLKKQSNQLPHIFHRHQVLLALKLALLKPTLNGTRKINLKEIGRYLLAISYHFEMNQQEPFLPLKTLHFEFTRQAIAQLAYFSHYGLFNHNFARAIEMWLIIPFTDRGKELLKQFDIDPHKEFLEETGLTIEEFISFGFMNLYQIQTVDLYTNDPKDFMIFSDFFSNTKLSKQKIESMYKYVRQEINDYVTNNKKSIDEKLKGKDQYEKNFLPLVEYPILKINDNMSIVADPQYLEERITQGSYWILLNKFAKNGNIKKGKSRLLSSYFGMLHQEYIYQSLLMICDEVVEVKTNDNDELADFIGIIRHEKSIYLLIVEAKKISLSLPLVLNSQKEDTINELKKVFFDKGFRQIFNTIHKIQNLELEPFGLEKLNVDEVLAIFPILAVDRFIVEESLNRRLYEEAFLDRLYEEKPFKFKPQVTHPMFLSSEEFDRLEAIIQKESKVELIKLLALRHDSLNKRFDILEESQFIPGMHIQGIKNAIDHLDTFWNFLYIMKPGAYRNTRLMEIFKNNMEKNKKVLF